MKRYNEDYFSVIDKRTGKKIMDCGEEMDALTMVSFDPYNRIISKNNFLMGPVVDIEIQKSLPTNEIIPVNLNENVEINEPTKKLNQIKLPENNQKPFTI